MMGALWSREAASKEPYSGLVPSMGELIHQSGQESARGPEVACTSGVLHRSPGRGGVYIGPVTLTGRF